MELPIVAREHFNRWYSLRAYYAALTLADAPIQAACIFIYIVITYLMTAQPLELYRFALFFGIILITAFVAQSLGLVVGALFNVKVRVCLFRFICAIVLSVCQVICTISCSLLYRYSSQTL